MGDEGGQLFLDSESLRCGALTFILSVLRGDDMTTSTMVFFLDLTTLPAAALPLLFSVFFKLLSFFGVLVLSFPSSLLFFLEFGFSPGSTSSKSPFEGGKESGRGDVARTGTAGGQFRSGISSIGERGRLVRFRFIIGLPWDGEPGAAISSRGCGRGGEELMTVLAGNGSEGGKSGLELKIGTVTESELFPIGVARLTGRDFGLSFGFRAGVIARSSSVISMASSAYGEDRFVDLRVRILARSEMSGEYWFESGLISWVVSLNTVGSERATIADWSRWSELGMWGRTGSLMDAFNAGPAPVRPNIGLGRGLDPVFIENSEIVEKLTGGRSGKDKIVDLADKSAPTEEMCDVFSAGIDVKVFILESAPSDGDTRVCTSLARGQP